MDKKIVILDFSTSIVHIKNIPEHLFNSQAEDVIEYFCNELNIREKDTQYMFGDLTIEQD